MSSNENNLTAGSGGTDDSTDTQEDTTVDDTVDRRNPQEIARQARQRAEDERNQDRRDELTDDGRPDTAESAAAAQQAASIALGGVEQAVPEDARDFINRRTLIEKARELGDVGAAIEATREAARNQAQRRADDSQASPDDRSGADPSPAPTPDPTTNETGASVASDTGSTEPAAPDPSPSPDPTPRDDGADTASETREIAEEAREAAGAPETVTSPQGGDSESQRSPADDDTGQSTGPTAPDDGADTAAETRAIEQQAREEAGAPESATTAQKPDTPSEDPDTVRVGDTEVGTEVDTDTGAAPNDPDIEGGVEITGDVELRQQAREFEDRVVDELGLESEGAVNIRVVEGQDGQRRLRAELTDLGEDRLAEQQADLIEEQLTNQPANDQTVIDDLPEQVDAETVAQVERQTTRGEGTGLPGEEVDLEGEDISVEGGEVEGIDEDRERPDYGLPNGVGEDPPEGASFSAGIASTDNLQPGEQANVAVNVLNTGQLGRRGDGEATVTLLDDEGNVIGRRTPDLSGGQSDQIEFGDVPVTAGEEVRVRVNGRVVDAFTPQSGDANTGPSPLGDTAGSFDPSRFQDDGQSSSGDEGPAPLVSTVELSTTGREAIRQAQLSQLATRLSVETGVDISPDNLVQTDDGDVRLDDSSQDEVAAATESDGTSLNQAPDSVAASAEAARQQQILEQLDRAPDGVAASAAAARQQQYLEQNPDALDALRPFRNMQNPAVSAQAARQQIIDDQMDLTREQRNEIRQQAADEFSEQTGQDVDPTVVDLSVGDDGSVNASIDQEAFEDTQNTPLGNVQDIEIGRQVVDSLEGASNAIQSTVVDPAAETVGAGVVLLDDRPGIEDDLRRGRRIGAFRAGLTDPDIPALRSLAGETGATSEALPERSLESSVRGAGIILDVPGAAQGLVNIGDFVGAGGAAAATGEFGNIAEVTDGSVSESIRTNEPVEVQFAEGGFLGASQEAGSQVVAQAATSLRERPVETGATALGALAGTALVTAGAARVSSTAGRAVPFAFQPTEEIATFAGGAALRQTARGQRILSRFPGGRLDNEEIVLQEVARAGRGIRRRLQTGTRSDAETNLGVADRLPEVRVSTEQRTGGAPVRFEVADDVIPTRSDVTPGGSASREAPNLEDIRGRLQDIRPDASVPSLPRPSRPGSDIDVSSSARAQAQVAAARAERPFIRLRESVQQVPGRARQAALRTRRGVSEVATGVRDLPALARLRFRDARDGLSAPTSPDLDDLSAPSPDVELPSLSGLTPETNIRGSLLANTESFAVTLGRRARQVPSRARLARARGRAQVADMQRSIRDLLTPARIDPDSDTDLLSRPEFSLPDTDIEVAGPRTLAQRFGSRQVRIDVGVPSRRTVFVDDTPSAGQQPIDLPGPALETEAELELDGEFETESGRSNVLRATETEQESGVAVQRIVETEREVETETDDRSSTEFSTEDLIPTDRVSVDDMLDSVVDDAELAGTVESATGPRVSAPSIERSRFEGALPAVEVGIEPAVEQGQEIDTEFETGLETETETEVETELETELESEFETEIETETEVETELETEIGQELELETEGEAQLEDADEPFDDMIPVVDESADLFDTGIADAEDILNG